MVPVEELEKAKNDEGKTKVVPKLDRPVDKWILHQFVNPARKDGAMMAHWTKEKEKAEIYPFARFNKEARTISYTDDEYKKAIAPIISDWDKIETDLLFEMCKRFSLRFIVIADRFSDELKERLDQINCVQEAKTGQKSRNAVRRREIKAATKKAVKDRTVDELKDRYYSVSREILQLRGESSHPIV